MKGLIAILAGLLFGFGLDLARMTDPERVLGFLDITGRWDPTLVFVLAGAVSVSAIGFSLFTRAEHSWTGGEFYLPSRRDIDGRLIVGSALFGIGWGIAGYCPGPGLAALTHLAADPLWFVIGMLTGMLGFHYTSRR